MTIRRHRDLSLGILLTLTLGLASPAVAWQGRGGGSKSGASTGSGSVSLSGVPGAARASRTSSTAVIPGLAAVGPVPFYAYVYPYPVYAMTPYGPIAPPAPPVPPGFGPAPPPPPLLHQPGAPLGRIDRAMPPADPFLEAARAERRQPTLSQRARQLITFGDRHFRADDMPRAEDRYRQALRNSPFSAEPRIRLAQVALRRDRIPEAAAWIREAIAAEPDWPTRARDIQALYGEPREFRRMIGELEAHVQAEPNDRDAWFVLGTQLYLSQRLDRAGDIFLRLTDRQPDAALAAFLEATRER